VYSEGNVPAELMTKANVVVSILPNVGSNDFAYLRHVVTHWHSLAPLLVLCEAGEPSKCSADAVLRPSGTPPVLAAFGVANENSDMMSKGLVKPRQDAAKVFKFSMSMREAYAFRSNTGTSYPLVMSGCANFHAWLLSTFGRRQTDWLVQNFEHTVYGGYFSVESAWLRRLPRELFAFLAAQQHHPNAEVCSRPQLLLTLFI
jgi:hypothetical protein